MFDTLNSIPVQGPYSHDFIFCNLLMGKKLMLYYILLARYKHSSLLGPFINYEENEVLCIQLQGLYSLHFIFFAMQEWPK